MKKAVSIIIFIGLLLIAVGLYGQRYLTAPHTISNKVKTQVKPAPSSIATTFSYKGENGKDALTLLKEKAQVKQDSSGLVVSINGRKADSAKHEFWAFYVNGKEAQVGPASYQTKGGDQIVWKIQTY